ncbi:hypothetical protein L1987_16158 [Smallanthus sonchifolius]|uniref:Uncharacterized protein n=1 Tax=Smallanthus sonchifolius TaxID=185202 RepID=A0ACB9J9P6_9ASTR|nr:hypothetical protein L1987_16158 [Smallanthus sonchifolius]
MLPPIKKERCNQVRNTQELELHPDQNPSYTKRGFRIKAFGDSNLRTLSVSFSLSHGFATSAAAEEIVSTEEEDSDFIGEMTPLCNKNINVDHRRQQKHVTGIGQGKYIALRRRQIKIETEAWEAAAKEYQELLVDMCAQKLAPNLPYVKSLFLVGKNRGAYAPQFDQVPADMMTIITMHKLMGLLMTGGGEGGYAYGDSIYADPVNWTGYNRGATAPDGGGVDKLSHEGRMAFTEEHLDEIFDSSDRLPEGKRWWLNAEDPFQCLATCINLSEALRSSSPETTISHMPIHQDGSCNGLQHYAALGRDKTTLGEIYEKPSCTMDYASWTSCCTAIPQIRKAPCEFSKIKTSLQVLTLQRETDKVMVKRQRTAFPPNFVHSLDGSHMMMTAIACKEAGLSFAGVHDSFWTHSCDVDQMNRILRQKFVELYEAPILENASTFGSYVCR